MASITAASLTLRSTKGSPLTNAEVDANFTNLNTQIALGQTAASYTAADVLAKLLTVDGVGSGLDADKLDGLASSTTHVASTSTIVARDTSGNFSATTITANLTGTASLASALTGTLAIAGGGTGAVDAAAARTNLGLVIGSDIQPFSNNLTALAAVTTHGFFVKDSAGTALTRSIAAGTNITVTNGDGVAGNPTVNGSTTPTVDYIVKQGANGSGDIGQSANRFAIIYGTSTSARYADLAEKYTTDQEYEPGTVIVVASAGDAEATASYTTGQRVLGVVSTNPAFIMNDELDGQAIALRGRVPVKVVGPIRKGQPLICNQDGKGVHGDTINSFAISLETNEERSVKLVECVIL